MPDLGMALRKILPGVGNGAFRTATPFTDPVATSRPVAQEAEPGPVGMSATADFTVSYGPTPAPLEFASFTDFGGVTSSGPPFETFTFAAGHIEGTIGVHFSGNGTGTLTVTSSGGGGPWVETSAGDIVVDVDETSGSSFDLTATLSYDDGGTEVLSSGAANLFYA